MALLPLSRLMVLYALGVVANMCTGLLGPIVARLAHASGAPLEGIGLALGAQFLPYLLGGSLVGIAAARLGARRASLLGLGVILLADLGNSLATSLLWLVASVVAQGAGMLLIVVSAQVALTEEAEGAMQARILSFWATAPIVGNALGLFVSSLVADGAAWRSAFYIHAALSAVLCVGVLFAITERVGGATANAAPAMSLSRLRTEIPIVWLSLGVAFAMLTVNGSVAVWPVLLSGLHGTSIGVVGQFAAGAMFSGIVGSLSAGFALSSRFTPGQLLAFIVAVAILSAAALYSGRGGVPGMAAAMVGANLATGATIAFTFAILPRVLRDPANVASATGLLYQLSCVGAILGAPIFLALAGLPNPALLLFTAVAACFAAMAALSPVWRLRGSAALGEAKTQAG